MERTIYRVIKKPKSDSNYKNRLSIVDFHDCYGMCELDIPVLPRGTVIEVPCLSKEDVLLGKKAYVNPNDWKVVDYYNDNERDDDKCKEILEKIKDLESFYKKIKNIIGYDDFYTIAHKYAGNICSLYNENPYFLFSLSFFTLEEIKNFRISPKEIAKSIDAKTFEIRRQEILAFIHYELLKSETSGHTGISYSELIEEINKNLIEIGRGLTKLEKKYFSAFINYSNSFLYPNDETARFYMDDTNLNKNTLVYRSKSYVLENYIYNKIQEMLLSPCELIDPNPTNLFTKNIPFSDEQLNAISSVFSSYTVSEMLKNDNSFVGNFSIITGGPGTGKTSIIKEIIEKAKASIEASKDNKNKNIMILTPTGRATKRVKVSLCYQNMLQTSNFAIKTIYKSVDFGKEKIEEETKEYLKSTKLILIDESSMLSLDVFKRLLENIDARITKIVLIGDVDQLPSVDAGNILEDLIKLGVPTARLTKNYRSGDAILDFAYKIKNKETDFSVLNRIDKLEDIDFDNSNLYFMDITGIRLNSYNKTKFRKRIKDIVANFAKKANKEVGESNWISLTSIKTNEEKLSSKSLSKEIAYRFRKENGIDEEFINTDLYHKDRVIICKTKYGKSEQDNEDQYYNGDIGVITDDEPIVGDCTLQYYVELEEENNRRVCVDRKNLELAYTLTIHKSQGSEYEVVCIIIPEKTKFLTRRLLYTGITRAKRIVLLLSEEEILEYVINNDKNEIRNTFLSKKGKFKTVS